ncbi:MAG TPA: hypothetical protein PLP17_06150 [Oligoflexia bacterium]|nr:hypothetical protein [Candidatus Defluviicoccus seviourii]HQH26960.1 hypothetical protein [Oligoflexia bacterium]
MKRTTKIAIMALIAPFSAGCATYSRDDFINDRIEESRKRDEIATAQQNEINIRWSVSCLTDQVTTVRRCWAATFARPMSHDGMPYGRANIAFQVSYLNDLGPYIITLNDYPGRDPTIRIDNNHPMKFTIDGPQPQIVNVLRTGEVARVRRWVWPKGSEDIFVVLRGLSEALDELDRQRLQR